jgi:hypothetical protein
LRKQGRRRNRELGAIPAIQSRQACSPRQTAASQGSFNPCIRFRDPVSGRPFEWEFHRRREIAKMTTKSRILPSDGGTMLNANIALEAVK